MIEVNLLFSYSLLATLYVVAVQYMVQYVPIACQQYPDKTVLDYLKLDNHLGIIPVFHRVIGYLYIILVFHDSDRYM